MHSTNRNIEVTANVCKLMLSTNRNIQVSANVCMYMLFTNRNIREIVRKNTQNHQSSMFQVFTPNVINRKYIFFNNH